MSTSISQEIKKIKVSYKLLKCFESLNLIMDEKHFELITTLTESIVLGNITYEEGENFLRELENFSVQEK